MHVFWLSLLSMLYEYLVQSGQKEIKYVNANSKLLLFGPLLSVNFTIEDR